MSCPVTYLWVWMHGQGKEDCACWPASHSACAQWKICTETNTCIIITVGNLAFCRNPDHKKKPYKHTLFMYAHFFSDFLQAAGRLQPDCAHMNGSLTVERENSSTNLLNILAWAPLFSMLLSSLWLNSHSINNSAVSTSDNQAFFVTFYKIQVFHKCHLLILYFLVSPGILQQEA